MDIKELEDLAQDKHADLKPQMKKSVESPSDAPKPFGGSGGASPQEMTTTASEVAESQSSKQPKINRDELAHSQNATKVNQDLFYQKGAAAKNGQDPDTT
jgi:hypothetical protein